MGLFSKKKEATPPLDMVEHTARTIEELKDIDDAAGIEPNTTHGILRDGSVVGLVTSTVAFMHDDDSDCEYDIVGESQYTGWLTMIRDNFGTRGQRGSVRVTAVLVRDILNEYDENAVAVTVTTRRVGFVPAADAPALSTLLGQLDEVDCMGLQVPCEIGWGEGERYAYVGVRLDLPADIGSATFEIVSREDIESA